MTFGPAAGVLLSNPTHPDDLLGWSACMGGSGALGVGAAGELCFSLTSDLKGAEPTGVWTLFLGASFGAGGEGHVGLARTFEVLDSEDICRLVLAPVGYWVC